MNLPTIDLASLPGIDSAMGIFGSLATQTAGYSDRTIAIMVYIYETIPV